MVFKFRMLSDENDNFVRDLEVPYDMTLRGFHEFLVRILGYEACMTSFFTAEGNGSDCRNIRCSTWETPKAFRWRTCRSVNCFTTTGND